MKPIAIAASLLLFASATSAQRTDVAVITLTGPGTPLPVQFTNVLSLHERSDRRVVVADACERAVYLLDFDRGTRTPLGRTGSGPGEYAMPYHVLPAQGDTSLVLDMEAQRLLTVLPSGEIIASSSPEDRSALTRRFEFTFRTRALTDSLGRIYFDRPGEPADSAPISRFDPRTGVTDTVAFVPRRGAGGAATPVPSLDVRIPYYSYPTWTLAPDGSVAIIRPAPFTLEWVSPSGVRSEPRALQHQPITIGEAEKEHIYSQRVESRGGCDLSVVRRGPSGTFGTMLLTGFAPSGVVRSSIHWMQFKDPYPSDDGAVFATPAEEIMVLAARAATDSLPRYDIYSRDGTLLRRLVLPPRHRLLGVGRGFVYLTFNDQNEAQHVVRYTTGG